MSLQAAKPTLLIVCLGFLACGNSPESYVETGKAFAAKGKNREAMLQYRKAIQKNNAFGPAYLQMGIIEAREARSSKAFDSLSKAVANMPGSLEPRVHLADLCLALGIAGQGELPPGVDATLSSMANEIQRLSPDSYESFRIRGTAALLRKHPTEAIPLLRKASALHPENDFLTMTLIHALYANGNTEEGERAGKQLIQRNKTYLPVYDELYARTMAAGDKVQARRLREASAENNPDSAEAKLALAAHYFLEHDAVSLNSVVQQISSDFKRFPDGNLSVGQFFYARGQLDQARIYLLSGSDLHREDIRYPKALALVLNAQNKHEQAIAILSEYIRKFPSDLELRSERASMLVESGVPPNVILAKSEFEDLLKGAPNNHDYQYGLGRALYHQGEYAKSRALFQRLGDTSANPSSAWLALGEVDLARGDTNAATEDARKVLDKNPKDLRGLLLEAKALTFSGQTQTGLLRLQRLARDVPNWIDVRVEIGRALIASRQLPKAEASFREVYLPGQSDIRIVQGLSAVALEQGKPDKAIELWQNEIAHSSDARESRRNLAETALRINRPELAKKEYEQILRESPGDGQAQQGLARAHYLAGNLKSAIESGREACKLQPESASCRAELATYLAEEGQNSKAIEEFRMALKMDAGSPSLMNNLAFQMAESGTSLQEAERLAQEVVRMLPSESEPKDTLAWVWVKLGKTDTAIESLKKLVNEAPKRALFRYHLGIALQKTNSLSEAKKEFEEALKCKPKVNEEIAIRASLKSL